jgi:hypothetical protein
VSTYALEAALLLSRRAHLFANDLVDFDVLRDASIDADALSLVEITLGVPLVDAFVMARAANFRQRRVALVSDRKWVRANKTHATIRLKTSVIISSL